MSLDRPSDGPSPAPEGAVLDPDSELGLASLVRMRGAFLLDALEAHLPGAREHADATASYAFAAAVELGGDRGHCELVREAAKLHDIGKVYVPRETLARDLPELSEEERMQFERHYESAQGLARGAGVPERVCAWLRRARERFDGHGPEGLAGDGIPLPSRIIRAACACDGALASPGHASPEATLRDRRDNALAELRGVAGTELDPRVVEALAAVLHRAIEAG